MRRATLRVTGSEPVGPYTLLRVARSGLEPGIPGQFFMLLPPGHVLPRPMSLALAPPGELGFLIDPIGPGTKALCALGPGDLLAVLGPLGNGYDLDVQRPLLVGGGIGIAPLPYLSESLGAPRGLARVPVGAPRGGRRARPERGGGARADLCDRAAAGRPG